MIHANSLPEAVWRKSSYSDNGGATCVEVVDGLPVVPVRDSKDKEGPALAFAPMAWAAFVNSVK